MKFLRSPGWHYALYLPAVLILIPCLLPTTEFTLFPGPGGYRVNAYADTSDGGLSTGLVYELSDSALVFEYTLRRTVDKEGMDPYAGLAFMMDSKRGPVDISDYDHLHLEIECRQTQSFIINLKTAIEGFTRPGSWRTYYFETAAVPVHLGSNFYSLPLENFTTPQWWWKVIEKSGANLPEGADRSKLLGIDFQTGIGETNDVTKRFIIRKITFVRKGKLSAMGLGMAFILYLSTITALILYLKRRKFRMPFYHPIKVQNHIRREINSIIQYIGNHYNNPELTVDLVARETGLAPAKISTSLQREFNDSFKQYLNKIRLAESRRLLRESDRTIGEIAFIVGYSNVTHFNRVFRKSEKLSPSEYRSGAKGK